MSGNRGTKAMSRLGALIPGGLRRRGEPDGDLLRTVDLDEAGTEPPASWLTAGRPWTEAGDDTPGSGGDTPGWNADTVGNLPPAPPPPAEEEEQVPVAGEQAPVYVAGATGPVPVTWVEIPAPMPPTSPAPGPWVSPVPSTTGDTARERRHWRNVQALYRRYNRAAVATVATVAGLLLLLMAVASILGRFPTTTRHQARVARPGATAAGPGAGASGRATAVTGPGEARTLTLEAESPRNTLAGSAVIDRYAGASGGGLVRAIGVWGGRRGPGALRFNGITVPDTGVYMLTFYFVNIKAMMTRTAVITTSAAPAMNVVVTGNSTCCVAQRVKVRLKRGANSITFANPRGEAPAIDKITIAIP